jgi:alginate production protein
VLPALETPALQALETDVPALGITSPELEKVLMASMPSPAPLVSVPARPAALAPIIKPAKSRRSRRAGEPLANLLVGQRVKIEIKNFKGRKLVADEIELTDQDDSIEIEGPVTDLDLESGTFSVGPARVLMHEKTKVEGSDRKPREVSELRNRVRVKVKAKTLKDGFIKARTIRTYEKSADRDFEIAAPIELISIRNSGIELLSINIKIDGKTEYINFGFVQGDYTEGGVGRRIRRDDDAQHPDPIRIGNVYLGGRVSMGFENSRNLDLDPDESDSDDWVRPSTRIEISAPLGEYSEAYARIDFRNANYFGNNPGEQGATQFRLREGFIYWGNFLHRSLGLQVGRQRFRDKREFLFDERLDAVRLHYTKKKLKVEVAVAKGVFGQNTSTDQQLYLMAYSQYRLPGKRYISGYFMKRNDTTRRDEDPIWYGMSSRGKITRRISYWGELARVTGRRGNLWLRGHAFDLGGSYRFPRLPLNQTLSLGYAYGSGDKDFSDGIDGNFTQTNLQDNSYRYNGLKRYRYYGVLLEPELRNVKIQTLDYGLRPSESWSLNFAYHAYRQVVAAKKIGDTELRMDPRGRDPRLGKELDVVVGIRKIRNIDVTLLMGIFFPGPAFVGAPPRAFIIRPGITYFF